jgi:hypothetical protein
MERCEPDNVAQSFENMLGNLGWWPEIPGIIPDQKFAEILHTGRSRFGAS